jgi:hypothetical protein
MIASVMKTYNPGTSAALVRTPCIEIESVFSFPSNIRKKWKSAAEGQGFVFGATPDTHSGYMEIFRRKTEKEKADAGVGSDWVQTIELLKNGATLRVRRGGVSVVEDKETGELRVAETYPDQIALKSQRPDLQKISDSVASLLYPAYENLGVYPYIRREVELKYHIPDGAKCLSLDVLPDGGKGRPESVKSIIENLVVDGKIEGVQSADDFRLVPIVTTNVDRKRVFFYIDPDEKINFAKDKWPSPFVTKKMEKKDNFVCIEGSLDRCRNRQPPVDTSIAEIMNCKGNDFQPFTPLTKSAISLWEQEIKADLCGANMTDVDAIKAYVNLGLAFQNYARHISGHFLRPTGSKGKTAIGLLPQCVPGGRYYDTYQFAVPRAP